MVILQPCDATEAENKEFDFSFSTKSINTWYLNTKILKIKLVDNLKEFF